MSGMPAQIVLRDSCHGGADKPNLNHPTRLTSETTVTIS